MTPLHVAAANGHFEKIVGYLVDKGATIDVKDKDGVSLHYWGRSILLVFELIHLHIPKKTLPLSFLYPDF